jgi:hypothetical protein
MIQKTVIFRILLIFTTVLAGYAQTVSPDRQEPDSIARPVSAPLGSWISRTIHSGDQDWFAISATQRGFLILETGGDLDSYLYLYDGITQSPLAEDDDGGDNGNSRIEYFTEPGKTYIAMVQGYEGETSAVGSYQFRASIEPIPADPTEPNQTRDQATAITLGSEVKAYFLSPTDIDWYRLSIPSAGSVVVYTEGNMDTLLYLYDSRGELIAEDDDGGFGMNARITAPLPTGTVYIQAKALEGQIGRYTLRTMLRQPVRPDRFEDDDTIADARDIQIGSPQERTISTPEDVDWVRLRITRRDVYDIRTLAVDKDLDTYLTLYDGQAQELETDDDGGDNLDARIVRTLAPGTYFIKVTTVNSDLPDNNAYTLTVTVAEPVG